MRVHFASILALAMLAACADMSGLGGHKQFACKAPPGVHCESLSATYYNSIANNLPAQRHTTNAADNFTIHGASAVSALADTVAPPPGLTTTALRAPGREMRIWIKAWEDDERDLVDQSYVYLVVDEGRWRVAHVQQRERNAFTRLAPPQELPVPEIAAPAQSERPAQNLPAVLTPAAEPPASIGK